MRFLQPSARTIAASALGTALAWPAPTVAQSVGSSEFAEPVRIEAGGAAIDTGRDIGHPGPTLRDHDGDGKLDLLVSAFRGNIRVFHNVGTAAAPKFDERDPLAAGGEPIRLHNW